MSTIQERLELLDKLHLSERDLMARKANDYSGKEDCNKNIKACEVLGICDAKTGLLIRMMDKMQRLITLSKTASQVKSESLTDTLSDLRNYAAIFAHLLEEEKKEKSNEGIESPGRPVFRTGEGAECVAERRASAPARPSVVGS